MALWKKSLEKFSVPPHKSVDMKVQLECSTLREYDLLGKKTVTESCVLLISSVSFAMITTNVNVDP